MKGKNLFRSTLGVLTGRLTLPFFSFLLFFVTARKLTVGDFGLYVMLTGLITLFQGISTLGLGQLLSREIGKQPEDEGLHLGSAVALILPASAVAYGLFLVLAYLLKGNGEFLHLAGIIALSLPLSSLIAVAESVFMARGTGANLFYIGLCEQATRVALSILALMLDFGLYGLTGAYVLSRVVGLAYSAYLYVRVEKRPPLRLDKGHIRLVCWHLKSFAPIMILGLILYRSDVLVLSWFLTDEEMGLYGCAIRIVNLSFIGPDSVIAAAFPHVSRRWTRREPDFAARVTELTAFLLAASLFGVVLMAAFAPVAVTAVFGGKFAASVPMLAVLGFLLPSHALELQAGTMLQAIGRERTSLILLCCSLPVFFGLIALGAGLGGLDGACIGFMAASWLMGVIGLKILPEEALSFRPGMPLFRALVLTLATLTPLLIWRFGPDAWYCQALAAAALTALFGSGIFKTLGVKRIKSVLS